MIDNILNYIHKIGYLNSALIVLLPNIIIYLIGLKKMRKQDAIRLKRMLYSRILPPDRTAFDYLYFPHYLVFSDLWNIDEKISKAINNFKNPFMRKLSKICIRIVNLAKLFLVLVFILLCIAFIFLFLGIAIVQIPSMIA